ncbi:MAG TPA: hypothetical protein VGI64_05995 [Streptosporangiaceae bacterium]|jgi:hypothetical protein
MTISQVEAQEPMSVRQIVAALVGESDDRERELARRLASWREGYTAGFLAGVEVGRGAVLAEEARQQREAAGQLAEAVEIQQARWRLRGERRTRQTFSQPHPADFHGRGGGAA